MYFPFLIGTTKLQSRIQNLVGLLTLNNKIKYRIVSTRNSKHRINQFLKNLE